MVINFSTAEDIDYTGGLIDNGSIVCLSIDTVEQKDSQSTDGNKYLSVNATVSEGRFAGSKIMFEQIAIAGSPKYKGYGASKIKAILEFTRNITDGKKGNYDINAYSDLVGMKILAVTKQEFYWKDGVQKVSSKIERYGSPRTDSSRYAVYEAYKNGTQPFLSPNLIANQSGASQVATTGEIPL